MGVPGINRASLPRSAFFTIRSAGRGRSKFNNIDSDLDVWNLKDLDDWGDLDVLNDFGDPDG